MATDRRTVLSTLACLLPFGLPALAGSRASRLVTPPILRLRSFEDAVRSAFSSVELTTPVGELARDETFRCCRIEVGHSEILQAGVQGCHNDRPFAGFPAGHLRIVRAGSQPGPEHSGVRLYISTVDVVLTSGLAYGRPSRPLDFATLPAAPILEAADSELPIGPRASRNHQFVLDC